ncbi:hypothetical protein ACXIZN_41680 [Amycolatopsis sp. TRM77291]
MSASEDQQRIVESDIDELSSAASPGASFGQGSELDRVVEPALQDVPFLRRVTEGVGLGQPAGEVLYQALLALIAPECFEVIDAIGLRVVGCTRGFEIIAEGRMSSATGRVEGLLVLIRLNAH